MHASVVKHYFKGGSFPIGGSSEIVNTINPVIEKSKGKIIIRAEVKEIIVENNSAVGVLMEDGKKFFSKLIISGVGVFNTYNKLISDKLNVKYGFKDNLKSVKPSVAHGCLYIGLKASAKDLKLPKHNIWIYPEKTDHDTSVKNYLEDQENEFPLVYISFPSAKDPSWDSRYPNTSTIDVITLLPYESFAKWEGTSWKKRGESYEGYKEVISKRLLEHLFKQLPHLREHIDHYELSSPLTTKNFVNYDKGELYGIDHTPERFNPVSYTHLTLPTTPYV